MVRTTACALRPETSVLARVVLGMRLRLTVILEPKSEFRLGIPELSR
jgi:hypothetical protein